jgi:sarcosine oxidase gamma subunit
VNGGARGDAERCFIRYTVWVEGPRELDPEELAAIEAAAEPHDATLEAKVARYIGGAITAAELDLTLAVPDGWFVSIEEGPQ